MVENFTFMSIQTVISKSRVFLLIVQTENKSVYLIEVVHQIKKMILHNTCLIILIESWESGASLIKVFTMVRNFI